MRKSVIAATIVGVLVAPPAVSQDVRNTYVGLAAQLADGVVTSAKLAASLSLTTPNINVATATSVNKVAITAPATSATLTITDGQTLSYAQGAWTPTVTTDGTVGTPAYTTQVGSYEKIGRQVTARFNIVLSGWTGSPTGLVLLASLPFTSNATANDFGSCYANTYEVAGLAALNYGITARVDASATSAYLGGAGSSGGGVVNHKITAAQFGTTSIIQGVCSYRTD